MKILLVDDERKMGVILKGALEDDGHSVLTLEKSNDALARMKNEAYDQPENTDEQKPHPGLTETMQDKPDHGEDSYRGSERLTGAALDRLTHRCHILETTGESYRLQDAKRRRRRTS